MAIEFLDSLKLIQNAVTAYIENLTLDDTGSRRLQLLPQVDGIPATAAPDVDDEAGGWRGELLAPEHRREEAVGSPGRRAGGSRVVASGGRSKALQL